MKTVIQNLAPIVKQKAGKVIIRRSQGYLDQIESLNLDMIHNIIRADVSNDKGDLYHVKWDLDNRVVSCTCPAHRHGKTQPCKHAVAVFRTVYHQFT